MSPIPQEIKSPIKLMKGVFFIDIMIIFYFWFFMSNFENFIHPNLKIFYTIFNVVLAIILVRPSHKNKGRRIAQTILFGIIKDKKVYHTDNGLQEDTCHEILR